MKNIFFALSYILSFSNIANSQNFKISKVIVDNTTKLPLENVSIYNDKDNSITNKEGMFVFVSSVNEINFVLIGYNSLRTTFEGIEKQDTVFMEVKAFELKEVVVANLEPFIKKVYEKNNDNFIQNYTSNFFLRNVLKKEDNIVKIQDIHGKRRKNEGEKNNIKIEISNMRKVSFYEKKNLVDLKFPDFNEFYSPPIPVIDKSIFTEVAYNDDDYRKILFELKDKDSLKQSFNGYFVIHKKDYAIVEHYISMFDHPEIEPYKKSFLFGIQYRTTKYERWVKYAKNNDLNKYYLSSSKFDIQVEVLKGKRIDKTFYFDLKMDYFTTNVSIDEKVKSNFDVDKDIFKAKFPYSADFWNNQNQLPLTTELKEFLKRVSENKDKKEEFEIIGNF